MDKDKEKSKEKELIEGAVAIWHRLLGINWLSGLTRALIDNYLWRKIVYFVYKASNRCERSRMYYEANEDRIKNIESRLADKKSCLVLETLINYRCTHNPKYWPPYVKGLVDKDQYFDDDIVKLGMEEVFVDCGAYIGDTIGAFLKKLENDGGNFNEIIALEPDPQNYEKLNNWVSLLLNGGGGFLIA